jgi:HK97 family phage major capsid protein
MKWESLGLKDLEEAIQAKGNELGEIFTKYDDVADIPKEDAERIEPLNKELSEMQDRRADLKSRQDAKERAEGEAEAKRLPQPEKKGERVPAKSIGQTFVESDGFKAFIEKKQQNIPVEIPLTAFDSKGTLGTDDSLADVDGEYAVQNIRLPGIQMPREQPLSIAALFSQGSTNQNAVPYMREDTVITVNAADSVAEGAAKPESTLAFEELTSPVRKLATWLPVTEEAFADVPALRSYVNNRLRVFLTQVEEDQLLNGDGIAPNLEGILNVTGIQTQAKGGDPTPDAIHKAMTLIWTGAFFVPDNLVLHPADWEEIRLLRTVDGIYIWGSPQDPGTPRIWGVPITQTTAIAEGTGLLGNFSQGATVYRRQGLVMKVSDSHAALFISNTVAILVEERLALVPFRPAAFATITGI